MKKIYSIPISWESYKKYEIEAESLDTAIKQAVEQFKLEFHKNAIGNSALIDDIIYDDYPDEIVDIDELYNYL